MLKLCAFADEASKEVEGQIAALQKHGIGSIELRGLDGMGIGEITLEAAERYAKRFREAGIRVWSIGSPIGKIGIGEDRKAHRELLRHVCRLARIFGTEKIRVFSFFDAYDAEETVLEELNGMVALARGEGCTLYHENEKKIFGDTLKRVETIMARVSGMKFIYDPANFIEVGEDPAETLPALAGKCDYFHIKDALRETGQIVPAGKGDGRIGELLASLPANRDFTLTLEPHLKIFHGFHEIDSTEMKHKYHYETEDESFGAAVSALKELILSSGYRECEGGYEKI